MRRDSRQQPLFAVRQFLPDPYKRGSVYDVLARYGGVLFRREDFPIAERERGGEVGWCPIVLSALVVLQQMHSWTDRETVRRATVDMQVKACLGLGLEQHGPSQPTLCRHRKLMQKLGLDEVYLKRLQALLAHLKLVDSKEPMLIDSVPIAGAGQQLDTYNLLAGATRRGLHELAARQGRPVEAVAAELGLQAYLHRTVKGRFDVEWDDDASKRAFLAELVADALSVRNMLAADVAPAKDDEASISKGHDDDDDDVNGSRAAEFIDSVVEHDVERDDDGTVKGIRQKAAGDRPIAVTDPDMRHGRKSASQLIAGYKAQIVASLVYGFIVLVRVIKANVHDGADLPSIVGEVEGRFMAPTWWGGDHAYGTLANHQFFDTPQRELVARMARPSNGGRFTKDAFAYDFDTHTLTCPAGHSAHRGQWAKRDERRGRDFAFPSDVCTACPLRAMCVNPKANPKKGRSVFIVDAEERLIRAHLAARQTTDFKEKLGKRPAVERVIAGFAQCGGKSAARMGQANVAFASNLSALAYNLRRLGTLLKADSALAERLNQALASASLRLLGALHLLHRTIAGVRFHAPTRHAA